MRTTLQVLLPVCLLLGRAAAQSPITIPSPVPSLRAFLGLTDTQMQTVLQNNDGYNRYSIEKQQRIHQIEIEIAQETAKENLDPTTLGIRYAEIEVNCRQLKQKAAEIQASNLGLLTDDQKAKLKTLESLIPLIPVLTQAQLTNLLGGGQTPPMTINGSFSYTGTVGLLSMPGLQACAPRISTVTVIRGGDFSASPGPAQ